MEGAFLRSSARSFATAATTGARERLRRLRHARADDRELALAGGEVDVEVQAAPLERVREVPRGVGGEHHPRHRARPERPELRHRHGPVREHLEQERLELGIGLVDLVHQEQRRLLAQ